MHDRPVPQRPGVRMHRWRRVGVAVGAAGQPVEPLDPVQHVLHRPDLRIPQRPRRGRWQPQQLHLAGGVAVAQQPGRGVHRGPGEERRQMRQVVVHRRRRHQLDPAVGERAHRAGGEVFAPADHFPAGDRRDPVMAEPGGEPGMEPAQVAADLAGDLGRADPAHRQLQVPTDPHRHAVVTQPG
ncbi:hypothetical protein [Frankia sp. Cr1]|uniref:hypothetical protein n=1 Tax=Frankia sp. Cr1 TaxID=3073931 RepID=UPI002AD59AE1|nr:hypothetical protein [Frankia sp. Cr1]